MTATVTHSPPTTWLWAGLETWRRIYDRGVVGEVYAVAPGLYSGGVTTATGGGFRDTTNYRTVSAARDAIDQGHHHHFVEEQPAMRYRIVFANETVGRSKLPPFEVEIAEQYGVAERTTELSRIVRGRVVDALTAAPAEGASMMRPVIEQATQIALMLGAGEGYAYYGTTSMGRFDVYPIS